MREELSSAMGRLGEYDSRHRSLVERLTDQLETLVGLQEDLWDCCPCGARCWGVRVVRPPSPHHARVPYVGPRYLERRILIVGMNSRDDGEYDVAFRGMADMLESFRGGRRSWGGLFQYRVARLVYMLAASQDARSVDDEPSLDDLANVLLASARVQAVQCAPGPLESRRSPNREMWKNCPPFVVSEQIRLLEPTVVALLGTKTIRVIQRLKDLKVQWAGLWRENHNCFARGRLHPSGRGGDIFALFHPSYVGGWNRSLAALTRSLYAERLELAL